MIGQFYPQKQETVFKSIVRKTLNPCKIREIVRKNRKLSAFFRFPFVKVPPLRKNNLSKTNFFPKYGIFYKNNSFLILWTELLPPDNTKKKRIVSHTREKYVKNVTYINFTTLGILG